jgi:hypothetical protein
MRKLILFTLSFAIAPLGLGVHAAATTNQKQCTDQFKAADLNNDGVLDRSEMGNARGKIPASLNNKSRITRKEYISACAKVAG